MLRRTDPDININAHGFSKVQLFLSDLKKKNFNFFFPYSFSKNTKITNFMKLHPEGAELSDVDRQTNRETEKQT
jgi:hypothetical protein